MKPLGHRQYISYLRPEDTQGPSFLYYGHIWRRALGLYRGRLSRILHGLEDEKE